MEILGGHLGFGGAAAGEAGGVSLLSGEAYAWPRSSRLKKTILPIPVLYLEDDKGLLPVAPPDDGPHTQ